MDDIPDFKGFPVKGLNFLRELDANNNRDWFAQYKHEYEEFVLQPSKSFVKSLGEKLSNAFDGIVVDASSRAGSSIMRIYRDVRFSKDKTPYTPRLRFAFWEGIGTRKGNPGFFVRITPSGGQLMGGMHTFTPPLLKRYRDAVVDEKKGRALARAIDAVTSHAEFKIEGKHYKRVPRPYDPNHSRKDLLLHNGIYASSPMIKSNIIKKPELVDVCFDYCMKVAPLHNWLIDLRG